LGLGPTLGDESGLPRFIDSKLVIRDFRGSAIDVTTAFLLRYGELHFLHAAAIALCTHEGQKFIVMEFLDA
jgi:hypothetical protein